jgi:regulatory protein
MTNALDHALRLLTRREHSAKELNDKLKRKGFGQSEIIEALDSCQQRKLQSDERFVTEYIRSRVRQGYGPLKIAQELKSKGVDNMLINQELRQEPEQWVVHAVAVWQKKCKNQQNLSYDELQKQQRFLLYRGFDMDIIAKVVNELT